MLQGQAIGGLKLILRKWKILLHERCGFCSEHGFAQESRPRSSSSRPCRQDRTPGSWNRSAILRARVLILAHHLHREIKVHLKLLILLSSTFDSLLLFAFRAFMNRWRSIPGPDCLLLFKATSLLSEAFILGWHIGWISQMDRSCCTAGNCWRFLFSSSSCGILGFHVVVGFPSRLALQCLPWFVHQVDLLLNLMVEVVFQVARNQVLVALEKVVGVIDLVVVARSLVGIGCCGI